MTLSHHDEHERAKRLERELAAANADAERLAQTLRRIHPQNVISQRMKAKALAAHDARVAGGG
jgi:predicted kinase